MGFLRYVVKLTLPGLIYETTKNVMDEGSLTKGVTRTVKETITEDMPGVSHAYQHIKNEGRKEGRREGYNEASALYEKKLKDLTDKFLSQKRVLEGQINEYKNLLKEYESVIEQLERKLEKTEDENRRLREIIEKYQSLKNIY